MKILIYQDNSRQSTFRLRTPAHALPRILPLALVSSDRNASVVAANHIQKRYSPGATIIDETKP